MASSSYTSSGNVTELLLVEVAADAAVAAGAEDGTEEDGPAAGAAALLRVVAVLGAWFVVFVFFKNSVCVVQRVLFIKKNEKYCRYLSGVKNDEKKMWLQRTTHWVFITFRSWTGVNYYYQS